MPPPIHIKYASLSDIQPLSGSGNDVYKATIGDQTVFYKQCNDNYPKELAQWEVVVSALLRVFLGERAAKVELVYDADENIMGVCSYAIPGFKDMNHVDNKNLNKTQLQDKKFISALFFLYFIMQDDGHPGNLGTNIDGEAVVLDYDMCAYIATVLIKGMRLVTELGFQATPTTAFEISPNDLINFPVCKDFKPCFWPTFTIPGNGNFAKKFSNHAEFNKLSKTDQTWQELVFSMMQVLVLPCEDIQDILKQVCDDASIIDAMETIFIRRQRDLKLAVLDVGKIDAERDFIASLTGNPTLLDELTQHYQDHNTNIAYQDGKKIDQDKIIKDYWKVQLHHHLQAIYQTINEFDQCKENIVSHIAFSSNASNNKNASADNILSQFQWCITEFIKAYQLFINDLSSEGSYQQFKDRCFDILIQSKAFFNQALNESGLIISACENLWEQVQAIELSLPSRVKTTHLSLTQMQRIKQDNQESDFTVSIFSFEAVTVKKEQHRTSQTPSLPQSPDVIQTIATRLLDWLEGELNPDSITIALDNARKKYNPHSMVRNLVSFSSIYSQDQPRGDEWFTTTLPELLANKETRATQLINECRSKGGWNAGSKGYTYNVSPSSNTLVLSELCMLALKEFRHPPGLERFITDPILRTFAEQLHQNAGNTEEKLQQYLRKHAQLIFEKLHVVYNKRHGININVNEFEPC